MSIQFSRYQCRACGKPVLFVRSKYDVPNMGYAVVLGFLSVDALIARDTLIAPLCLLAAAAVAVLWAIHTVVNLFVAAEPFRCQACGTEAGATQRPI
jgi:hypothetical protein